MAGNDSASMQRQKSRQEQVFRQQNVQEQKQFDLNAAREENVSQIEQRQILRADDSLTAKFAAAAGGSLGSVSAQDKAEGQMTMKYKAFYRSKKALYNRQREQWRGSRA